MISLNHYLVFPLPIEYCGVSVDYQTSSELPRHRHGLKKGIKLDTLVSVSELFVQHIDSFGPRKQVPDIVLGRMERCLQVIIELRSKIGSPVRGAEKENGINSLAKVMECRVLARGNDCFLDDEPTHAMCHQNDLRCRVFSQF